MDSKLYKLGFIDKEMLMRRDQQALPNHLISSNCSSEKGKSTCNQYTLYPAIHRKWEYGSYTCKPNIRYIF